jgi:hypothetical protein
MKRFERLHWEGIKVGRKHVRTLLHKMGIAALYDHKAPHPEHLYPLVPSLSAIIKLVILQAENHGEDFSKRPCTEAG